ncbi:MAG: leucine--tRNA ligase [Desulfurococcales archaeon]|nr:leucine--tRNA ligase [Desulfurococcales archaeon]
MAEGTPIVEAQMIIRQKPASQFSVFLNEIARKWQDRWSRDKVFQPSPDPLKPKYFITAAFPYPNGPIHIGHLRVYTITDVMARYKRMRGYNVLFPMAFHYTGTPVLTMAESVSKGDESLIKLFREGYGVPDHIIPKLGDPLYMARYFHEISKITMKEAGYSIDWRREFTTIDPDFSAFIRWQFTRLKEKGFLVQGTHPVGWCPVHNMPVGMHDTKGDVEPEIGEFTIIKFFEDDTYYPAATLRPETVFGVTNLWINPRENYVVALVDGEKWVLSEKAAYKLGFQLRKIKVIEKVKGSEFIGKQVVNPVTGKKVPILPADFVDPNTATGVVMSVPAHAPFDLVALNEISEDLLSQIGVAREQLAPIPLIEVEGYSEVPARDAVERLGVKSQLEKEKLDQATKQVYSAEYSKGRMRKDITRLVSEELTSGLEGQLYKGFIEAFISGKPVSEAREELIKLLKSTRYGDSMYEILNKPVYCRCGNEIVVKVLDNQWFLDYGKPEWKELARKLLSRMKIVPEIYRNQFNYTIEWVDKRACARTRGLGTELPWAPGWIIESLSDSTIYMAFYTINYLLRSSGVKPEQLKPVFWDYVLLGRGDPGEIAEETGIPLDVIEAARAEFDYWYPLDSRNSGKDLIPNHLTFFIYNHAGIFPEDKWPKQITVNGFVLVGGLKMSKSLGNVVPMRVVLHVYGVDAARAAVAMTSEIGQDANFTDELMASVTDQLRKTYNMVESLSGYIADSPKTMDPAELDVIDRWMLSRLSRHIENTTRAMDEVKLRDAYNTIFYMIENDLSFYMRMTEERKYDPVRKYVIRTVLDSWIRMMQPAVPHIAEEMWSKIGGKGYVSLASWPEPTLKDVEAEVYMEYVKRLVEDIKSIVKVAKKRPEKIVIVPSPPSELSDLRLAIHFIDEGKPVRELVKAMTAISENKKQAAKKAFKLYDVARNLPPLIKDYIIEKTLDEEKTIESLKFVLEKMTGAQIVVSTEHPKSVTRKKESLPMKPAIYIF